MSERPRIIVRKRSAEVPAFPERFVNGSEVYSVFDKERVFSGWVFRLKAKDPKPYAVFGNTEAGPKFLGWFRDHLEAHATLRAHAESLRERSSGTVLPYLEKRIVKRSSVRTTRVGG